MGQRFGGRVVIITGASAGIGAAAARQFAAEGARVVLAARGVAGLDAAVEDVRRTGGDAIGVPTDVADIGQLEALVERAVGEYGQLDIVVNNAGANARGNIGEHDVRALATIVDVNLRAPIALSRIALPHLRKSSAAAIVNVASLAGRVPLSDEAVYSATKFGLRAFSIALSEQLERDGVKVVVVSPGPVDTGFIMDEIETVPDLVFSQPMSSADQIAELILASAADGRVERMRPVVGGYLATMGYVFPPLRRVLRPVLERRGRKAKQRYRERNA